LREECKKGKEMSVFAEVPPDEPLPLIILVKGDDIKRWEALAQATIPMLLRPEDFPQVERCRMAQSLRLAMGREFDAEEAEGAWNEQPADYEPGECLEWGDE
jgi:hypothetical protein